MEDLPTLGLPTITVLIPSFKMIPFLLLLNMHSTFDITESII